MTSDDYRIKSDELLLWYCMLNIYLSIPYTTWNNTSFLTPNSQNRNTVFTSTILAIQYMQTVYNNFYINKHK